jgi:hypothetical protein
VQHAGGVQWNGAKDMVFAVEYWRNEWLCVEIELVRDVKAAWHFVLIVTRLLVCTTVLLVAWMLNVRVYSLIVEAKLKVVHG